MHVHTLAWICNANDANYNNNYNNNYSNSNIYNNNNKNIYISSILSAATRK